MIWKEADYHKETQDVKDLIDSFISVQLENQGYQSDEPVGSFLNDLYKCLELELLNNQNSEITVFLDSLKYAIQLKLSITNNTKHVKLESPKINLEGSQALGKELKDFSLDFCKEIKYSLPEEFGSFTEKDEAYIIFKYLMAMALEENDKESFKLIQQITKSKFTKDEVEKRVFLILPLLKKTFDTFLKGATIKKNDRKGIFVLHLLNAIKLQMTNPKFSDLSFEELFEDYFLGLLAKENKLSQNVDLYYQIEDLYAIYFTFIVNIFIKEKTEHGNLLIENYERDNSEFKKNFYSFAQIFKDNKSYLKLRLFDKLPTINSNNYKQNKTEALLNILADFFKEKLPIKNTKEGEQNKKSNSSSKKNQLL